MITVNNGEPALSLIPLILDADRKSLYGHFAKANPQWRQLQNGQNVTALFQGPHAYISPAWYEPQDDNVPTWNYVAAEVKGQAEIIDDPTSAFEVLKKMTQTFEARYQTGWHLPDTPSAELKDLLRAIVAFKINIETVRGKFKLSQAQPPKDRETVIQELPRLGTDAEEVAAYMRKVNQNSPNN